MDTLLFDPFSGASGDMVTSSLLDLGAPEKRVVRAMETAAPGSRVEVQETTRSGITATHLTVHTRDQGDHPYTHLARRLEESPIPPRARALALGALETLGRAESRVHGAPLSRLHLHEMGDILADLAGAAVALDSLRPRRVLSTPIATGGGTVRFHGRRYPVPAPATLEILRGSSLLFHGGPADTELLTPTGAALLATMVHRSMAHTPPMEASRVGYGAGTRDLHLEVPNVLRTVGGRLESGLAHDPIEVLETNLDDVTGEVLGGLLEDLISAGARDALLIPATMKKGRPGHLLQVVAHPRDEARLLRKIVEETGSLGVRIMPVSHRMVARRETRPLTLRIGGRPHTIRIKVATDTQGGLLDLSAEYDDARKAAKRAKKPVRLVQAIAEQEARKKWG